MRYFKPGKYCFSSNFHPLILTPIGGFCVWQFSWWCLSNGDFIPHSSFYIYKLEFLIRESCSFPIYIFSYLYLYESWTLILLNYNQLQLLCIFAQFVPDLAIGSILSCLLFHRHSVLGAFWHMGCSMVTPECWCLLLENYIKHKHLSVRCAPCYWDAIVSRPSQLTN